MGRIVPTTCTTCLKQRAGNRKHASAGYLVVGLGASAGGLEALEEFFDELPANPGMAFVVVTHQSADKVSLLTELIGRHCKMPVQRVDTTTPIEPNRVYVQPPGATLGVLKGALFPFEPRSDGPKPLAIDFFFRSLAQDQKDQAVGIVLSGTGSDGTNGLKEIRAVSGLVMAQDEQTARYSGMPHSASVALQLDFVLAPRDMARQLLAYRDGPTRTFLSSGSRHRAQRSDEPPVRAASQPLRTRLFELQDDDDWASRRPPHERARRDERQGLPEVRPIESARAR